MGSGPWWHDFGWLRVVLWRSLKYRGKPFLWWRDGRQWELSLGWIEFRWRVHHGQPWKTK